jgi:Tat protein secretion system quality control protein TatD with DNase activity
MADSATANYRIMESLSQAEVLDQPSPAILMKACKTREEVENFRAAHVKDGAALCRFLHWVKTHVGKEPITELSAAAKLAAFRAQLALARDRQLPVVLHCVRAFEPVMLELAAREPRAVIFHGFIGSPEQARRALEKGYYLSFGVRTFSSPKTLEALRETPPGQLFLETDDSDTGIEEVYAHAAAVRGTTVEALKRATTENYERIFAPQNG